MNTTIRDGNWFKVFYSSDGHLVLFDKLKSEPVEISREAWPDFASAEKAEIKAELTWIKLSKH